MEPGFERRLKLGPARCRGLGTAWCVPGCPRVARFVRRSPWLFLFYDCLGFTIRLITVGS